MTDGQEQTHDLAERFLKALAVMHKMTKHRPSGEIIGQLNLGQIQALHLIHDEPGISQKALARRLEITAAAISNSVRELEALDLIERRSDPADARQMRLHLSRRGRALTRKMRQLRIQAVSNLLSALPREEQVQVVEALERALAARQGQIEQNGD